MYLPEKKYFSINEISKRWNVGLHDLQYYGENGLLEICVKSQTLKVALGEYVRENDNGLTRVQQKIKLTTSPHPLHPVDIYRIFQSNGKHVLINRLGTKNALQFVTIESGNEIPVCFDDMVVTLKERNRFESEYKITPFESYYPTVFLERNNCSEIFIHGKRHKFGILQARVVKQLYDASLTDEPWMNGKILLKNAESEDVRISGLFNHHSNWRDVILSDKRGLYRLNIPHPSNDTNQLTLDL